MAQSITVQALVDASAQAAGLEYSSPSYVTTAEHLDLVRRAYDWLRNRLVDARGAEYFATATSFATVAGTASYALLSVASDLLELLSVVGIDGTDTHDIKPWEMRDLGYLEGLRLRGVGHLRALRYRLTADAIELQPPPTSIYTIKIRYVPRAPVLVTGAPGAGEANSIDSYSGFHLWIVYTVAIALRRKRMLDTSDLERERALIDARLDDMRSKRDALNAPRIVSRGHPWSLESSGADGDVEALLQE